MGAPRRGGAVFLARGARPRRLRQLRTIRGACRGRRSDPARPARDDDRHRAASAYRAACKQAASVHQLSGGRLTLALAVGARTEDYETAGVEHRGRAEARRAARLHPRRGGSGPRRPSREGIELLVGGLSGQAFSRMARYADGYAHGGGPPRAFASAAARAEAAWKDLGRPGKPRLGDRGYFGSVTSSAGTPTSATTTPSPAASSIRRREPDEPPRRQGLRPRVRGRPAATSSSSSRTSPTSTISTG